MNAIVRERFSEIVKELNIDIDLGSIFESINKEIQLGAGEDYAASRGEYLNGRILANWLGWDFVDAKEGIFFDRMIRMISALCAYIKCGKEI